MTGRETIIILALFLLVCSGCRTEKRSDQGTGHNTGEIVLTGEVADGQGSRVWIEEMAAREYIPVDTVVCDENGRFELRFPAGHEAFYVLHFGENQRVTLLMKPGEKASFIGPGRDGTAYRVEGSPGSTLLQQLAGEHRKALDELGKVARSNMELSADPGYSLLKPELDRRFDSVTAAFRDYSLGFIRTNRESLAILVALYNMYGQGLPVFHPREDLEVYRYVDSVLYGRYQGYEAVELLHAQIEQAASVAGHDSNFSGLEEGMIAPDFVSSKPDGTELALSDLRGNYVLVSFWAAWSTVSREENQFLRAAYDAYRDYPFTILQVSLDDDRKAWEMAIAEDALDWEHVSDLQRWDSPVVRVYRVEKIPGNILIDPRGRILDMDLLGESLNKKLQSVFNP